MRFLTLVLAAIIGLCSAHDEYHGSCPVLTPMSGFNWNKVSTFRLRSLALTLKCGFCKKSFIMNAPLVS